MCGIKFLNFAPLVALLHTILYIIEINECSVAKILLMNVTKMNKHLNVARFVHALIHRHTFFTEALICGTSYKLSNEQIYICSYGTHRNS